MDDVFEMPRIYSTWRCTWRSKNSKTEKHETIIVIQYKPVHQRSWNCRRLSALAYTSVM